jgi:hypothetical protein
MEIKDEWMKPEKISGFKINMNKIQFEAPGHIWVCQDMTGNGFSRNVYIRILIGNVPSRVLSLVYLLFLSHSAISISVKYFNFYVNCSRLKSKRHNGSTQ